MRATLIVVCIQCFYISIVFCQFDPNFYGNRSTIVHLFEWKWYDIADECERFLQHKGYGGVQISPPNENVIIENRPWWERYQPVSYILNTRSGDETAFQNMTRRSNAVGVRIYADAVINHMAATDGVGVSGSVSNWSEKSFPAVPYGPNDFHASCKIHNYLDAHNVRNCELESLRDLDHERYYVRKKIVEYMNQLIDLGVAGFRIDAAKHMWPTHLKNIINKLKYLNTDYGFPPRTKPFIFQEVVDFGHTVSSPIETVINKANRNQNGMQAQAQIIGNEACDMRNHVEIAAVTEFKYQRSITNVFKGNDKLKYLRNWGPWWNFVDKEQPIVFVDNHDTQRQHDQLIYKSSKKYKMANAFMLAHPYGIPKVMSSFDFNHRNEGPPQNSNQTLISPKINPDGTCGDGYICEHRWRQIANMVEFKNIVKDTPLTNWWSNDDQQIAFCRGNKGFVVFTNWGDIEQNIETCLPQGKYCDIISGSAGTKGCSGKTIEVDKTGKGFVTLSSGDEDGVVAIHINSRID